LRSGKKIKALLGWAQTLTSFLGLMVADDSAAIELDDGVMPASDKENSEESQIDATVPFDVAWSSAA